MFDLANTTVVLNGFKVDGWSDDTDCLSFPDLDIAAVKRGATGKMVAASTGNKGGRVDFKVLPNTETSKFLANLTQLQKNGARFEITGFVKYQNIGVTVAMVTGVIVQAPGGITLGKGEVGTQVYGIEFEQLTPDYSLAEV